MMLINYFGNVNTQGQSLQQETQQNYKPLPVVRMMATRDRQVSFFKKNWKVCQWNVWLLKETGNRRLNLSPWRRNSWISTTSSM